MTSRSLDDLLPQARTRAVAFLAACHAEGIDLIVTCTYRSYAEQRLAYNQGRTMPGHIVTKAKPGMSWHQWRCALDVVPLCNGKPVWDYGSPTNMALWLRVGTLGEAAGLEWAWRWRSNKEMAHFQHVPQGVTLQDCILADGRNLDNWPKLA